jgi:hypothetical protein
VGGGLGCGGCRSCVVHYGGMGCFTGLYGVTGYSGLQWATGYRGAMGYKGLWAIDTGWLGGVYTGWGSRGGWAWLVCVCCGRQVLVSLGGHTKQLALVDVQGYIVSGICECVHVCVWPIGSQRHFAYHGKVLHGGGSSSRSPPQSSNWKNK